jgi:LAO/AO transport system kinase
VNITLGRRTATDAKDGKENEANLGWVNESNPPRSNSPMTAALLEQLARELIAGDRRALGQAITLIESSHPDDRAAGNQLLELLNARAGNSIRVGLSGVPGVGKSTFIEALGNHAIERGHRVAVLAVDPSSERSGGSILGDKTRMQSLSRRPEAFIRPSPAGRTLGGVARQTQATIALLEAAGYDVVIVETVGVGQSETAVAGMTDTFILLLLPGGGDELQGIKRGIIEHADLVVVNKADGDLAAAAGRIAADYRGALPYLRRRSAAWEVAVQTCSAIENRGITEIWALIERFRATMTANGELAATRAQQARQWLRAETVECLLELLRQDPEVRRRIGEIEANVGRGAIPPRVAADELVRNVWKRGQSE